MKKTALEQNPNLGLIKCCFFFTFMLLCGQTFAQNKGKVQVIRDPLFDTLLAKRAELNRGSSGGFPSSGYRVQIYSGSNRSEAYAAQGKFNREFPEIRTYIVYREPNFKVRAGDFRSRLEAEKMQQQLRPWFSTIFIVSEKINLPLTANGND